jgi:hypothetical protein
MGYNPTFKEFMELGGSSLIKAQKSPTGGLEFCSGDRGSLNGSIEGVDRKLPYPAVSNARRTRIQPPMARRRQIWAL